MSAVFGLIVSKVKGYWQLIVAGASAILLFLIYLAGRKDGRNAVEAEINADVIATEKHVSDFYKEMGRAEREAEANRPDDPVELVERLRNSGL